MDGETLTRIGTACLLLGLGWLLVGGALALSGAVPALRVGYGVASAFTAGTLALAAGSPPGNTPVEAALGAGGVLTGVAWLLVGVGAYLLTGTVLPGVVGAVLLLCGVSLFAYFDSDDPNLNEFDRSGR